MRGYFTFFILLSALSVRANITLPAVIGSNMVLQQKSSVKLWGWGNRTEKVYITNTWNGNTDFTVVTENAKWQLAVTTPVAVRYAFSNTAVGNLFSKEGMPVAPFRTDDWDVDTAAK